MKVGREFQYNLSRGFLGPKRFPWLLVFVWCLAIPISTHAYGEDETTGFSGNIQAGALWIHSTSQLDTTDDNKETSTLNDDAGGADEVLPAVLFECKYGFDGGTGIYLKTPYEDGFGLAAGVTRSLGFASVDVSGFYRFEQEAWEDPYITGTDRQETDVDTTGGDLKIGGLFGTKLDLVYAYRKVDVENDRIGDSYPGLRRDGDVHTMNAEYKIPWGEGNTLAPEVTCTLADMDGKANTYTGYEGGLSLTRATSSYRVQGGIFLGYDDYDEIHPIFSKTRKEDVYGVRGLFTWFNPFGFEKWFVNVVGFYKKTDANIGFFDAEKFIGFVSTGYRF